MMIMHLHFYSPYQSLISLSKVILELLSCATIIRQLPKAHPSPIEAVGSGRRQRWAAPLCSVLESLVSIGPTSCSGSSPSSTRMLVFVLLPVVGEFDFGFEETITLDLFQRWWSGSLRGRGTVLTVRLGSACTGGEIMSKCAERYSSSETVRFTK